jgi:hypothetical protein
MKPRRAKCLAYLGSERKPTGFRHFYEVDGRKLGFFTSVDDLGLPEHSLRIAAAHAGLANLVDLNSITLPEEVVIGGIQLSRDAVNFWKETARNVAAERMAEDGLAAVAGAQAFRTSHSTSNPNEAAGDEAEPVACPTAGPFLRTDSLPPHARRESDSALTSLEFPYIFLFQIRLIPITHTRQPSRRVPRFLRQ